MHCLRPDAVVEAAANFVAGFPGDVLYAVKCNPDPAVLLAGGTVACGISTAPRRPRLRSFAVCSPTRPSTSCTR
jgi:hypothetical protein